MLKYLFALPLMIAATAFSVSANAEISSADYEMDCHSHHNRHSNSNSISTSFLLTPVGTTGYTLSATALQQGRFSVDSSGTITLPHEGDYLIDFSIIFASDEPTRATQLNMLWNGIGVFQLFDSHTASQVATVLNFNGTTLVHATGPVTIQTNYENFGGIATLVPLNGVLTVKRLQQGKSNH